nr:MAG TPA: DNA polymerase II small subunit [Caudoviricetes sp.]
MADITKWTEQQVKRLSELANEGLTNIEIAPVLSEEFGEEFSWPSVRSKRARLGLPPSEKNMRVKQTDKAKKNVVSTEIKSDGTQTNLIKLRMTEEQSKNPDYVLQAHGYDPENWELVQATNNIWEQNNQVDGLIQLYQSKIVVRPKMQSNSKDILVAIKKGIKPIKVEPIKTGIRNLVINLTDIHMGIIDYEYMKPAQDEIIEIINKGYKTISFNIIGDLVHNDSMVNPFTTKGTLVDEVDMVKAIEDLKQYIEPMVHEALKHSKEVRVYYVPGNHDLSISYMFMQYLQAILKGNEIEFDCSLAHRKAYMLDNVLIGIAHGDLARKNLPMLLATEFPHLWGIAKTREYFVGHFHSEKKEVTVPVQDKDGVTVRQLSTLKKSDYYEVKNGYTTSRKKLQIFEFNNDELKVTYDV